LAHPPGCGHLIGLTGDVALKDLWNKTCASQWNERDYKDFIVVRAMRFMTTRAGLVIILLLLGLVSAAATVRIHDDGGGQIGPYLAKYRALRASGERVEIDGTCASACTMLLGIVPRNHICITPRAALIFHSAWDMQGDQAVTSDGNRILWSTYPESVRRWIRSHGGLHSQTITLSGPELAAMFPACR
jgi:hypothetical protein